MSARVILWACCPRSDCLSLVVWQDAVLFLTTSGHYFFSLTSLTSFAVIERLVAEAIEALGCESDDRPLAESVAAAVAAAKYAAGLGCTDEEVCVVPSHPRPI